MNRDQDNGVPAAFFFGGYKSDEVSQETKEVIMEWMELLLGGKEEYGSEAE